MALRQRDRPAISDPFALGWVTAVLLCAFPIDETLFDPGERPPYPAAGASYSAS
jgi:hypothetical protein